ncbi:3'(2'),5'-bisphosphate nucleotidase CysQ [Marinicauda algicola]|nr:3'(2'),5'-bisphosphate nucleotidase CysQ [Marinicauda algicola]
MHDAAEDLALIADAAKAAGDAIMGYYRQDPKIWDKGGNDPVTEADYAANRIIRERLTAARPDYGWLSEENPDDESRLEKDRSFVVDPLDGTRAFIKHRPEFVVSIGVLDKGHPLAGVLYDPCEEALYAASREGGAFRNGDRIWVSDQDRLDGARILGDPGRLVALRDLGAKAHTVNSVALRLALVACGAHDAVVAVRPKWDWDLIAGHLLVEEAGGVVTSRDGRALRYDLDTPRQPPPLAAGPRLHALLLERLI